MQTIIDGLTNWRGARNMESMAFNKQVQIDNLDEEVEEYDTAITENDEYEEIDALCDLTVFSINNLKPKNPADIFIGHDLKRLPTIDDISNCIPNINGEADCEASIKIVNYCYTMIESKGYDYVKCMNEAIKMISSRQQDPVQKAEWEANGVSGKWQKWKEQPEETKYKADYASCKKVA